MRDKVALNLPVVMTKRTNKKLAQDNPFFSISVEEEGGLAGECRVCQARAVRTHHTWHTLDFFLLIYLQLFVPHMFLYLQLSNYFPRLSSSLQTPQ